MQTPHDEQRPPYGAPATKQRSKSALSGSTAMPQQRTGDHASGDDDPVLPTPAQSSPHRPASRRRSAKQPKQPNTPQRQGDRESGDADPASHRFLTGPQTCRRYGLSSMGLWRWLKDGELGFPPPAMIVNGRRFWREQDLLAWEASRVPRGSRETASA